MVSPPFRRHDVTSLAAKVGRSHVRHARYDAVPTITKLINVATATKSIPRRKRIVKINLRIDGGHLSGRLQLPSSPQDADWDENEPKNEEPGEYRSKMMPRYGLPEPPCPQKINDPKADQDHR